MFNAFYGIKNLLKGTKNTLFPIKCALCGCETKGDSVCENCDSQLDMALFKNKVFHLQNENSRITCAACFDYNNDRVIKLIYTLKRCGDKETVNYCSLRMMRAFEHINAYGEELVFTAVPRSNKGMHKYGFDQACLLAKRTSEIFLSAKYKRLIARSGFAKEQKELDEAQRMANVSGKFRAKTFSSLNKDFSGNIIIFDDVCTTGASMLECVKVIKRKYSKAEVYAVFLAKTTI